MNRRLAFLLYTLPIVLLLIGAKCPPTPPTPTPTPTPTPSPVNTRPTSPVYTDLLLRQNNGRLTHQDGSPYKLIGAIPCWPPCDDPGCLKVDGKPVDYWWPLVSPGWMQAVAPKGVNALHIRLGPGVAAEACCGLQDVGGPYLEAPALSRLRGGDRPESIPPRSGSAMKAAPKGPGAAPQWNQKYWDRVHLILNEAGRRGFVVEVDVVDGWLIKHSIWGDTHMPWPAPDVVNAAAVPLNASLTAWVDKVQHELCFYGNVIKQISNESEGIPGWSSAWESAVWNELKVREDAEKCVVQMIGSNTRAYDVPADYFQQHDANVNSPISGRPVMQNEWNPAKAPASFKAECDADLAQGTGCWYWRSNGDDATQDASLNSINGPVQTGCHDPLPDRNKLIFNFHCVNGNCDTTPINHGDHDYCVAIGMGVYGDQPRYDCPMRNECGPSGQDQYDCASRLACEQYAMQAPSPVFTSDGAWHYLDDGHFRVKVDGTWIRACDSTGQHCSQVNVQ